MHNYTLNRNRDVPIELIRLLVGNPLKPYIDKESAVVWKSGPGSFLKTALENKNSFIGEMGKKLNQFSEVLG